MERVKIGGVLSFQTSMDMVQYSLVNWEQVKGSIPDSAHSQPLAGTTLMFIAVAKRF